MVVSLTAIMKQNILFFLLIILLLINPLLMIFKNRVEYFSGGYMKQRYADLKKAYYSSQYVNKHATGSIPDDSLEAFAGGIFLKGLNPILIVHDQPPLGRYIIALSILIFDNAETIPVIFLIIVPIGLYLIALQAIKNKFIALIPVGIFINEPMYLHKFIYLPLLEPIQLPFIIFAVYAFILGIQKKQYIPWFILTTIMLGFVISIRYFVLGGALTVAFFIYLLLQKKIKMLIVMLCALLLSVLILLSSYFQTFRSGYSLVKVLGIQKYIFWYHKSAYVHPFSYWDLLLFNRWHTWWGDNAIIKDPEWIVLWPISVFIIALSAIFISSKKLKFEKAEQILFLWIISYSIMLSIGYTSTRYFLPLIPFLYVLSISFIVKIIRLL